MPKRTTQTDVARAAGVSVMSVSKALNGKKGVSAATQKLILDTAHRLNYHPNMVAKNLRLDKTNTLGVVVSDSSEMVMAKVLRGISDSAFERGYNIMTVNTDSDSERERAAINLFVNKCVDGIIMIAPTTLGSKGTDWVSRLNVPMTVLMRDSTYPAVDSVISNNLQGGHDLAEHLVGCGCRSFKFLSISSAPQVSANRLEGVRQALHRHGYTLDPARVRECKPYIQPTGELMRTWLAEEGCNFDALICSCDVMAIGAIDSLLSFGVDIPGKVCVTGYDDIELAEYLRIPLTTIRQPLYDIGCKGVEALIRRIEFPNTPTQHISLNAVLVERESSRR